NVFHKRVAHPSESPTFAKNHTLPTYNAMQQLPQPQSIYQEGQVLLAISAINQDQIQSVQSAAATYSIPQTTLRDRRAGKPSRHDYEPNSKKLTKLEE
ncbi:hypothetical protein CC78DRAFT_409295, partial [Lojkania enalia]